MKTLLKTCIVVTALLFNSCIGEQGPVGPAGEDGNANVKSSSLTTSGWNYLSPDWYINFSYNAITQDILDNGAVLVYVQSGSNYFQLPYTFYPSSTYSRTYTFKHYLGGLSVYVTDSDLTQPANPGLLTFKVVVIASSALAKHPNVDLNNYNEVKKTFELQN
jgi:hypothetical protein